MNMTSNIPQKYINRAIRFTLVLDNLFKHISKKIKNVRKGFSIV